MAKPRSYREQPACANCWHCLKWADHDETSYYCEVMTPDSKCGLPNKENEVQPHFICDQHMSWDEKLGKTK